MFNIYKSITAIVLTAIVFTIATELPVQAQDAESLVAYRDTQGVLYQSPENAVHEMRQIAKRDGYVTLWLMLNYPYDIYTENMSLEQTQIQSAEVQAAFAELLQPMIADGDVWEPASGPYVRGPGCMVRATKNGLRKLVNDERLIQVLHAVNN